MATTCQQQHFRPPRPQRRVGASRPDVEVSERKGGRKEGSSLLAVVFAIRDLMMTGGRQLVEIAKAAQVAQRSLGLVHCGAH